MTPFILALLGLLLILFEFYLPGAVLGVLGSLLLIASVIVFASQSTSPLAIALFIIAVVVVVILLIRFALWRIVHAKPEYSIYLNEDQEGFKASSYDKTAIGKKGVALADLKPGGFVLVEGKQHQALSISGYIAKGEEVAVIGGQEESLIVKSNKKDESL